MTMNRRSVITAAAGLAAGGLAARVRAQDPALKIGVLTDMSGILRDVAGPVAVASARQAVEDFHRNGGAGSVEILVADHQHKADIGAGIARRWFDQDGVDVIVEGSNSAVALAVSGVAREKDRVAMISGAGTSNLTGSACNANTVHWAYDTYMLAKSTGAALVGAGGKSWFFITTDYAFGHAMQRDTAEFVTAAGGTVLGNVAYPFTNSSDFSSQLVQAKASGAKIIGLASAGPDTTNQIKQANEFGIRDGGTRLAGLLLFISEVHAIGLEAAQGLVLTNSFYWDLNDRTRAFSERLRPKAPGTRPTMVQAGVYGSTLHYLKTAQDMGFAQARRSGAATVARMKAMPTDDDAFGPGSIRQDGRKLHPAYLWQIKSPAESRGPWDYFKLLATTPAADAFRPMLPSCASFQ